MRLVRFCHNFASEGHTRLGVVDGDSIIDLAVAAPTLPRTMPELLAFGVPAIEAALAKSSASATSLADVTLLAPIERPGKILGIGLNYRDHAAETGREPPAIQTWFVKQATAVNDPYGQIAFPKVSSALDYEVELVVVIGKRGRHVPAERAHEIIAGFCVGNDVSVRDWQRATPTMIMGKGFDTHAPFGPWIVTPDELGPLPDLRLRCFINGELRQNGRAGDMIFGIEAQIAHLTAAFTLEPGDVIFTGTPAGVGVAMTPPGFMKPGDIVRCEIDGIGGIESKIVAETGETVIG
jgi:2-keto-4-pentenoate hydratase/2-oxohepta-3-ene-1,7-dioic acid hydratase in catechol pathway